MFTVCPKCALTLVVTAADLRVAQGYVRCGRCSNVFNALARLSEDRQAAVAAAQATAATAPAPPVAPTPPASRATDPQPPLDSIEAEGDDDEPIPEGSLEFDADAADVSKVFVEPPPNPEWTAATGSFKAIVLRGEEAAHLEQKNSPRPPTHTHTTPPSQGPTETQVDIELDADFLSATSQMRRLRTGEAADPAGAGRGDNNRDTLGRDVPNREASSRDTPVRGTTARTPARRMVEPDIANRDAAFHDAAFDAPAVRFGEADSTAELESADGGTFEDNIGNTSINRGLEPPRRRGVQREDHSPRPSPSRATPQTQFVPPTRTAAQPKASPDPPAPEPRAAARPQVARSSETPFAFNLDGAPERSAAVARSRVAPGELAPARGAQETSSSATLWSAGAGALVILLAAQIVNHYRNDLAANAQLNKPVTALYAAFGVSLTPRWDLHAYDVRQLGASADAASSGQIMVRASVKNGARQAQPMPLLRVTLQDRFGNRIAARDVSPQNYLPRAIPASSFLSAGQRIDAEMAFVDPGSNAVGFEIDACLPAPAGGIACANDPGAR
jgi:predicted Zn finger-like uncharacterized protein